jgi:hypothetical protein
MSIEQMDKAKKFLDMMIKELPRTHGDFNLQLMYDDLKALRLMLEIEGN